MDEVLVPAHKRRKRKGKLDEDLMNFDSKVIEHTLTDEQLAEHFPEGYRRLPDEVYRKLELIPAVFEVHEHHIAVYKGKNGKIVKAEHPKEMLNGSIATPSIVSAVIHGKYTNAVPLYRQEQEFARVRHIPLCAARLDRVAAVNQLSREIVAGKHTPSQARAQLDKIQHMPPKPRLHQVLASGAGSACFCFLFGGDWLDSLAALLAGLVLYLYLLYIVQGRLSKIASNISGGALVTLVGILLYQAGIGHHLGEMIIGSIIPLVPGVAFTTAIRDIADEDYIAGAVRMLDALLVTFCIAMGVGLVMMAYHHFVGGLVL